MQQKKSIRGALLVAILLLCTLTVHAQSDSVDWNDAIPSPNYASLPRANWDSLVKYAPIPPSGGTVTPNTTASATPNTIYGCNPCIIYNPPKPKIVTLTTPPIGNQYGHGTCVGWAVAYTAMSTLLYPKYNNCWGFAERSPNYVYNQLSTDCSTGTNIAAALYLVQGQGVCSMAMMPFDTTNSHCDIQPDADQRNDAANNKAININWGTIPKNNVDSFKKAIDLGYPVIIEIKTSTAQYNQATMAPGIWDSTSLEGATDANGTPGYHAICIVGYDDGRQLFKLQDQAGLNRYDSGFFWMTYNFVATGLPSPAKFPQPITEAYVIYSTSTPPAPIIPEPPAASVICRTTATTTIHQVQVTFPASTADNTYYWKILDNDGGAVVSGSGTAMLAGSEALVSAMLYYGTVKEAAKQGVITAKPIYEDLKARFSKKSNTKTPPTP